MEKRIETFYRDREKSDHESRMPRRASLFLEGWDLKTQAFAEGATMFRAVQLYLNPHDGDINLGIEQSPMGNEGYPLRFSPKSGVMYCVPGREYYTAELYRHLNIILTHTLGINKGEASGDPQLPLGARAAPRPWLLQRTGNTRTLGVAISGKGVELAVIDTDSYRLMDEETYEIKRETIAWDIPAPYQATLPAWIGLYNLLETNIRRYGLHANHLLAEVDLWQGTDIPR